MNPPPPRSTSRNHLLVEPSVQGVLLRRVTFYLLACGLYFVMSLVITESLSNPREAVAETTRRCLDEAVFWAPGIMLLLPMIVYDLLKITNRVAGPLFRLRREMQLLANGKPTEPLTFRDQDYWQEIAESFNQLRHELLERRHQDRTPSSAGIARPLEATHSAPGEANTRQVSSAG